MIRKRREEFGPTGIELPKIVQQQQIQPAHLAPIGNVYYNPSYQTPPPLQGKAPQSSEHLAVDMPMQQLQQLQLEESQVICNYLPLL
jgi:hypothetical protein